MHSMKVTTAIMFVGVGLVVMGLGAVGLNQFVMAQQGLYKTCAADAGSGEGPLGISIQSSFLPTGFTCSYPDRSAVFHDVGTPFTMVGLIGAVITLAAIVFTIVTRRTNSRPRSADTVAHG